MELQPRLPYLHGVKWVWILLFLCLVAETAFADDQDPGPERWHAPFGGTFSANFTLASEYTSSGISQTQLKPAFQAGLDYKSPLLPAPFPLWLYASVWGSNVDFPTTGSAVEIQLLGGVRFRAYGDRLGVDLGYIHHAYPGIPASLSYDYDEISLNVGYDFGVASLAGRLRYSPDSYGNSGPSWNKRASLAVPLPFLKVSEDIAFKLYGTLGNIWVDRYLEFGIPSADYWYWQVGLVTSAYGLDFTTAFTDTSIEPSGCAHTRYCAARFFVSVTKVF